MTGRMLPELAFVPPSLRGLPVPPTFLLRELGPSAFEDLRQHAAAKGLAYHDTGDFRDAVIAELERLWTPQTFSREAPRVRRLWLRIDNGAKLKPRDAEDLEELQRRAVANSPRLQAMEDENREFTRHGPRLALATQCNGWAGLRTPYGAISGTVPDETLSALEAELDAIERAAGATSPISFFELRMMAALRVNKAAGEGAEPKEEIQ